jgi:hypothetical protein
VPNPLARAAITWRLPATVNALARDPALTAAEMITLLAAGTGIWLELTGTLQGPGQLPRPARAAMAAAAMWTIWVLAYLTGMSGASWFAAYRHGAPGGLGAAADQQIAVAILWAVPALCFLPFLSVTVVAWLGASAAGNERPAASGSTLAGWIAAGLMPRASPVTENLRAWVRYPTARPPDQHAARSRGIRKSASGTRRHEEREYGPVQVGPGYLRDRWAGCW